MFTGIIEEVGTLAAVHRRGSAARIVVEAPGIAAGVSIGDSVAISGVCLTAIAIDAHNISFDAVPETIERSSLKTLKAGDPINIERSLQVGGRLGGHFVQGHVDGTGTIKQIEDRENAHVVTIEALPELMRYIAPKGSIAIDGISLTVVDVRDASFTVWIIPHTFVNTTIGDRKPGDSVNLEIDMLARYIERLLEAQTPASSLSEEKLMEAGFET
jgi:riboflavin synthase